MALMTRALAPLIVAIAAAPALAAGAGPSGAMNGRIVEEVVATIRSPATEQTRVITLSRLAEEARIALVSRGAVAAAVRPLDGAALRAALEWLIDQTVLIDEATRLQVFEVERADVVAELSRFRSRFARPDDYRAFLSSGDLSEEELMVVLRRMLRVQRYLDGRVRHAARIGDVEVAAYYREHEPDFGGRGLEAVREAVRAHLAQDRMQAEVKAVVSELRGRMEIRLLEDFTSWG
jgi:hypothetical protein